MNKQTKSAYTIYDIAQEAGVSPSTVSRVINGNSGVKADKRLMINRLVEKHNFTPNAAARTLFKKESKMIGCILPDISNPFFASVFLEIEKNAIQNGMSVLLCNSLNSYKNESIYLDILTQKQVDSIIFMGGRVNDVHVDKNLIDELGQVANTRPVIIINGEMKHDNCYRIISDEQTGIYQLVEYLASLGHKDFGFIGGIVGISSTDIKIAAFKKIMQQMGYPINKNWFVHGDFSVESGRSSIQKLLDSKPLPTALICVNDDVAIGVMDVLHDRKIKVPDDISVTGFDDVYLCDLVRPKLTTVSQNYTALGKTAYETIGSLLADKPRKLKTIVTTKLVIRDSCCPPLKCI